MDAVANSFEQTFQDLPGCLAVRLLDQLRNREFTGPIHGDKEKELAFCCPDFGNIDMKEPNWIALEALLLGLVAVQFWQA